jgi:hypothetical protein
MEMSGQLHVPVALPPGNNPQYVLYRRLGWPQRQSGHYGEKKVIFLLPGIEALFLCRPAHSLAAIQTSVRV